MSEHPYPKTELIKSWCGVASHDCNLLQLLAGLLRHGGRSILWALHGKMNKKVINSLILSLKHDVLGATQLYYGVGFMQA